MGTSWTKALDEDDSVCIDNCPNPPPPTGCELGETFKAEEHCDILQNMNGAFKVRTPLELRRTLPHSGFLLSRSASAKWLRISGLRFLITASMMHALWMTLKLLSAVMPHPCPKSAWTSTTWKLLGDQRSSAVSCSINFNLVRSSLMIISPSLN